MTTWLQFLLGRVETELPWRPRIAEKDRRLIKAARRANVRRMIAGH